MNFPNRQRGISVAGLIMLILIVGGGITAGTKLAPFYLDHNTISTIMEKMAWKTAWVKSLSE